MLLRVEVCVNSDVLYYYGVHFVATTITMERLREKFDTKNTKQRAMINLDAQRTRNHCMLVVRVVLFGLEESGSRHSKLRTEAEMYA